MTTYNNYYDKTDSFQPYTTSAQANANSSSPANALRSDSPPTVTPGYWPCLNTTVDGWVDVEDNRGKVGYVDGVETTIIELGPLPDGWSDTPPAPTPEQLVATARAERNRLIESVRWRIDRHNDELALGREPTEPLEPLLQYVQELRDVPQQPGFPESVEWPECPGGD